MSSSRSQRKNKILKCLEEDPVISVACSKANIARATYYRWLNEDKAFANNAQEALRLGNDKYNDLAESKLMSLIMQEDIRAIMFRLNNMHPDYSYPKVVPYNKIDRQPLKPIEVMNSIKRPHEK